MTPSGARFNRDGLRRHLLWRRWGQGPRWLYVGLNPSTAGAEHEDQSTRKMRGFAERGGAGSYVVANLFDWRATKPRDLYGRPLWEICSKNNIKEVCAASIAARVVVCIWGNHGKLHGQAARVLEALRAMGAGPKLRCLQLNGDGSPAHVLMLPYSLKLIPYNEERDRG